VQGRQRPFFAQDVGKKTHAPAGDVQDHEERSREIRRQSAGELDSASTPPAEAPTTTMSRKASMSFSLEFSTEAWETVDRKCRERSAYPGLRSQFVQAA
jgi:hypothetical protein